MARARYTKQFAVVGTETQGAILEGVKLLLEEDKSVTVRAAVDAYCGLEDGELRMGDTLEAAIERTAQKVSPGHQPAA